MKKLLLALILLLAGWWTVKYLRGEPAGHAPRPADGVLVSAEPVYGGLDFPKSWLKIGSFQQWPEGSIDITARILARHDYPREGFGQLVKTDLVLGWGPMSDNRVIDHVAIHQNSRGMELVPDATGAIKEKAAYDSTALVAVYSDFNEFSAALDALRVGDVIRLYGWQQKLKDANGAVWNGGTGNEPVGQRAFVVQVLKLQVGDRKVFGNWNP